MFKFLFKFFLLVFLLVLGVVVYVGMSFQIVRTDDGYHFIRKKERGFDLGIVDTRDWNALDYLRHADISEQLARIRWESWKESVSEHWSALSESLDSFREEHLQVETDSELEQEWKRLQETIRDEYQNLTDKLKKGDLDLERYRKQIDRLKKSTEEKLRDLRDRLARDS